MPTWHPTGGGAGTTSTTEDVRMGTMRKSMQTNPLLARDELGKVKNIQFNHPDEEHVFGLNPPKDAEGAREVTMLWKTHEATVSPGVTRGKEDKPQADFKTMNKIAVCSGITNSKDQQSFRNEHVVPLKAVAHSPRAKGSAGSPTAPPDNGFGKPTSYRTAEVVRSCGPQEPPIKHVIQGAYAEDWVKTNIVRDAHREEQPYIPPVATRAAMGHSLGAQKYLKPEAAEDAWKLTKFKVVPPRVVDGMGGGNLMTSMKGIPASSSPKARPPPPPPQDSGETGIAEENAPA